MVTVAPAVHTDEELVARAAGGDRGAFAALYERYFERIFDFSLRIVRDSDTAADVVQGAFAKAWEQLSKGKEPRNFKAWLYTVARNKAIDELRHGRRQVPLEERDGDGQEIPFAHVETHQAANPQAAAQDHELADLVWSAASALKPAEYALLDMHLRQGLSAEEMAAELGVAKGNVYTRLSRLRHSLEEAVTSTLLVRRGRRECEALDALLAGFNTAELTPETRAVVQRHLEDCPRCQESKRRFVSPAEIFAGLGLLGAAPALRSTIWQRSSSALRTAPPGSGSGVPSGLLPRSTRFLTHGTAASKMALAGLAAGLLAGLIVPWSTGGSTTAAWSVAAAESSQLRVEASSAIAAGDVPSLVGALAAASASVDDGHITAKNMPDLATSAEGKAAAPESESPPRTIARPPTVDPSGGESLTV